MLHPDKGTTAFEKGLSRSLPYLTLVLIIVPFEEEVRVAFAWWRNLHSAPADAEEAKGSRKKVFDGFRVHTLCQALRLVDQCFTNVLASDPILRIHILFPFLMQYFDCSGTRSW